MKNKSDFLLKLHSSAPAIFHRELLVANSLKSATLSEQGFISVKEHWVRILILFFLATQL